MASSVNTSATRSGCCASMLAFHRSRTSCRTSVPCTLTTIHMQDLAGDERRVLQIENGVDYVIDLAETTDRMQFRQGVVRGRIVHRCADYPERDGVRPKTAPSVFHRQCPARDLTP